MKIVIGNRKGRVVRIKTKGIVWRLRISHFKQHCFKKVHDDMVDALMHSIYQHFKPKTQ